MAKKVITKKSRVSVAKKRWYSVQAPAVFNNIAFGETLAVDPKYLPGRRIRTSLGTVVRSGKKNSLEVLFEITELKGTVCETKFIGYQIPSIQVKRYVKRAKSRADDSFVVKTKDGVSVRLKPLLLLRAKVQRGILTSLRQKSREYFAGVAEEMDFSELVSKTLSGELQRNLKAELKQIYPVNTVEMRALKREK